MRGFSLIELMIALAVLVVLTTVAIPAYNSYVIKAQRSEGRKALMQIALAQERFFTINNRYTANISSLARDPSDPDAPFDGNSADTDPKYAIALTVTNSGQRYTTTATPKSGKAVSNDSDCTKISLNYLGVQSGSGASSDACW
ncbi:MAG: type IV pilin protein [Chromatiales bacterium]|nr:type IV pilin protein [Chromatiales bacterium]